MAPLTAWQTAIANRATNPAKFLVIGDSISEGQGASIRNERWVSKFRQKYRTKYATAGVTSGSENYIPATYSVGAPDSPWNSYSGFTGAPAPTVTNGTMGYRGIALSAAGSVTYTIVGTAMDIWYVGTGGTFSYKVDGNSAINVVTSSTYHTDYRNINISLGAADSSHTVVIAWVSGTIIFGGFMVYNTDRLTGIQYSDSAKSGAKSGDFLVEGGEFIRVLNTAAPDLIFIELGGNDALQLIPAATFQSNLNAFASSILGGSLTKIPSLVFVCIYTPQTSLLPGVNWNDYRAAMQAVVNSDTNKMMFMDLAAYMPVTNTSGTGYYRPDGLHPNDSGHSRIADVLFALTEGETVPSTYDSTKSPVDNEFSRLITAGFEPGSLRDMQNKELSANPTTSITDRRFAAWAGSGSMIEKAKAGGKTWVDIDD